MTLAERLAAALVRETNDLLRGDSHDLTDHDDPALVPAAVLVAITDAPDPGLILTQRTDTLRHHAGQVAFPGGRIDAGEDAVGAALREAHEEIALPPDAVEVIGTADAYRTGTGYLVTPVVGLVPPALPLVPSESEVAAVFEVPLSCLFDPANQRTGTGIWQGRERRFLEIAWRDRRIWGATAAMIVNLARRLQP